MAEADMPKVGPAQGGMTREKSSLSGGGSAPRNDIQKVELKGKVVQKKQSFGDKLKETFIAEDARDVGDYILWDILVPTIKRTIRDIIVGSADRIFLGTGTSSSQNLVREHGVTRVVTRNDYSSISSRKSAVSSIPSAKTTGRSPNFGLNDVIFESYDDAANVLDRMVDFLETYGNVSVDDFFDLVGKSAPYTAQNWGWKNLSAASIVTVSGGYFIKLPTPVIIKEN